MSDDVNGNDEHEHDDDDGVVFLIEEDGEEHAYGFLGELELDDRRYALIALISDMEAEGDEPFEVRLLRWTSGDESGESFEEIEDDDERARVEKLAESLLGEDGMERIED